MSLLIYTVPIFFLFWFSVTALKYIHHISCTTLLHLDDRSLLTGADPLGSIVWYTNLYHQSFPISVWLSHLEETGSQLKLITSDWLALFSNLLLFLIQLRSEASFERLPNLYSSFVRTLCTSLKEGWFAVLSCWLVVILQLFLPEAYRIYGHSVDTAILIDCWHLYEFYLFDGEFWR